MLYYVWKEGKGLKGKKLKNQKNKNQALKKVDKVQQNIKNPELLINQIKLTIEIIALLVALINLFNLIMQFLK